MAVRRKRASTKGPLSSRKRVKTVRKQTKKRYVYIFGGGTAEGDASTKEVLGGKGAGLAEMANLGLPVPAGFTISTEMCAEYYRNKGKLPKSVHDEVDKALRHIEKVMGVNFDDPANPLLVSCRSGARQSMPGMMETVLNIGLTSKTIPGLIAKTRNPRFVYDAYRRLIQMYTDVVMEKAAGLEPAEGKGVRQQLEHEMGKLKEAKGAKQDTDLTVDDLKTLIDLYKAKVQEVIGKPFPDDSHEQLWGGIAAVFQSWNGRRAISYRRIEGIPDDWGTAVNVQAMVFGNMGDTSATGVAFTRNPATGDPHFYGEWLPNAQGEDVVAGTRTPNPLNEATRPPDPEHAHLLSLEKAMPETYKQLVAIRNKLEKHYRDMQDIEFTIQEGRLWMLQTRTGKRNGPAAVRMAVDMQKERLISIREAVSRVTPGQLEELLHPILDPMAERTAKVIAKGLPAGPGGATGQVVFTANDAVAWANGGKKVILVREETNPEDVEGMRAAQAILTARGGMTSHAALVARGWGKCCIVGAGALEVEAGRKEFHVGSTVVGEGDWVSLNGTEGKVYLGKLPLFPSEIMQVLIEGTKEAEESEPCLYYLKFIGFADKVRRLGVRANADTPEDAENAKKFGAEGIGLFRTEHMFYGKGAEEPLFRLRKMILSTTVEERRKALDELYPYIKADIKATLEAMDGLPVTIRTLDPPLHEFVPNRPDERQRLAESLGISLDELASRAEALHETNPMMGHRGVRLGITYPEITETWLRGIFEAAAELIKAGRKVYPEIMIPVTCDAREISHQAVLVKKVHDEVVARYGLKAIPHSVGTMIEIPRAALRAADMARVSEFFSFGTNDLTQMGFGFSRDDIGAFVPDYIEKSIIPADPFQTLDTIGVGELMKLGIERGRAVRPKLKVGICGEHGGDPASVHFCHEVGMDYVSCSPFRVPIARLAAAQAALSDEKAKKRR